MSLVLCQEILTEKENGSLYSAQNFVSDRITINNRYYFLSLSKTET